MAALAKAEAGEPARGCADRCPYSRAFTPDFVSNPPCPAYQGTTFVATDTAHRPLGSAVTCRHLTVGNDSRGHGRFYPRCALGGSEQRLRWVATVTPARVEVMRSLEEEFDELTSADRAALVAAKGRLLEGGTADTAAVAALERQLGLFLGRVDAFISERADRLADVGLRAGQLRQLLSDWSLAWLHGRHVFGPGMAVAGDQRLEPGAAAFLGAGIEGATSTPTRAGELVARAGALVIERSADGRTLRLRGEIDVTNSDAVATAVMSALVDGDVIVDFGDVLFCDVSGLRAVVRAAGDTSDEHRITVTGLPKHLQRAVRLVGWADVPGLLVPDAGPCDGPRVQP